MREKDKNYIRKTVVPEYCIIYALFLSIIYILIPNSSFSQTQKNFALSPDSHIAPTCGFGQRLDILQHINDPDPILRSQAERIQKANIPQRDAVVISPAGHFSLHYDTTGSHSVPLEDLSGNGVPDYIDSAAVILDYVWAVEIDQLGFRPPPDEQGNPRFQYPVYFTNIYLEYSSNSYGYTMFDIFDPIPGTEPNINIYASYIELSNNFYNVPFITKGLDAMRVTAAHEFNHALQIGYNVWLKEPVSWGSMIDRFFMEATSTWMEDYVYHGINDYFQYLPFLFDHLDIFSFNEDGVTDNGFSMRPPYAYFPYANCLYLHMAEQLHSAQFAVETWDEIIKQDAVAALDAVLNRKGSSFAESQNTYASWLYFTGDRAVPGSYFPEGAKYPMLQLPLKDLRFSESLVKLGMMLYEISNIDNRIYEAVVSADNPQGMMNHISAGDLAGQPVSLQKGQVVMAENPLISVLSNAGLQSLDAFTYQLKPKSVYTYPNPIGIKNEQDGIFFSYLPDNSIVTIYDILGRRVKRLDGGSGSNDVYWNLKNEENHRVSSGMYLFRVESSGFMTSGKIIVVR